MSDADAPASAKRASSLKPAQLIEQIRSSPIAGLVIGLAAALAVLVALMIWLRSPDYAVLYSGLTDQSGGEVVAELEQMQIDYRLSGGGSQILVPSERVNQTRLALADRGLPKQGNVGLELMDTQPFGASEFSEQINFQRGLQGELQRSIETIREVRSARVQLALPKDSVFVQEKNPPKASVILELARGRDLSDSQVTAIQHLVASAVPGMQDASVDIVNEQGRLLTDDSKQDLGGASQSRLTYIKRVESRYEQRIADLIGPMVGADNMRVSVTADINFDQRKTTSETFRPNENGDGSAVRSRETQSEYRKSGGGEGGVPGALSNQPTPDQPSPINNPADEQDNQNGDPEAGNAQGDNEDDLQRSGAEGLADDGTVSSRSVVNYEVSQVVESVQASAGGITGLSAAVVLNESVIASSDDSAGADGGDGDGDGDTSAPDAESKQSGLSADQLNEIRGLVAAVLSAGEARRSQVEIVEAPFVSGPSDAELETDRPPFYMRGDVQALALTALKYGVALLILVFIWRRILKPQLERAGIIQPPASKTRRAEPASPVNDEPQAQTAEASTQESQNATQQRDIDHLRRTAQEYADKDPNRVASVVKQWISDDE